MPPIVTLVKIRREDDLSNILYQHREMETYEHVSDALTLLIRQKSLIFRGIPESQDEDCLSLIINLIQTKLQLKDFLPSSISHCSRLGAVYENYNRPIVVRFTHLKFRSTVWDAKSLLSDTNISVMEYLTQIHMLLFVKARRYFGKRRCWTHDGEVFVKIPDGRNVKVSSLNQLNDLIDTYREDKKLRGTRPR